MISIYLTNLGKYNSGYLVGRFVKLPIKSEDFKKVLLEIGIDGVEYEEYFITDVESDISGISEIITEYTSVQRLNELAEKLEMLSKYDEDKLSSILESERVSGVDELFDILENLENWTLYSDVEDEADLGYLYADNLGVINIPENLKSYFNYKDYGTDIHYDLGGTFTTYGYIYNVYWVLSLIMI